MKRLESVIGRPVHRHVEDAIRREAFIARWRPVFEAVEAMTAPIILTLGGLLVLAMGFSFAIAIATHRMAS